MLQQPSLTVASAAMTVRYLQACRALKDMQAMPDADQSVGAPAEGITKPGAGRTQNSGSVINAKWYSDQINNLSRKYGPDMVNTREYQQISAAWAAHKSRGNR